MEEDKCYFNKNQLNFFRVCHLATNVLPCELRAIFIHHWNRLYSQDYGTWRNEPKNGLDFVAMESNGNKKRNKEMLDLMQDGNVDSWDCTKLFYALLFSTSVGAKLDETTRKHVDSLREFRNHSFAHVHKGEISSCDFQVILNTILRALLGLKRDTSAVKRTQNCNSFSTDEVYELQEKLEHEMTAQLELDNRISSLEGRVLNLENKATINDSDEECDYSNIVQQSFEKDESFVSFVMLAKKPNHPVIQRQDVGEITETLDDLKTMHTDKITSVTIIGEPLSGKTECTRQIGQAISSRHSIVATIQGNSLQSFTSSLKNLAHKLGFRPRNYPSLHKASLKTQIEIISLFFKEKLASLSSWVIILDDVLEETREFLSYLPQPGDFGSGQLIVTTQDRTLVADNPCTVPVILDRMTLKESLELLSLLCDGIPQDLAEFVSEKLEYQPAFLASAATQVKLLSGKKKKSMVETWAEMLENIKCRYKEEEWPYYVSIMDEPTHAKLESVIELVMKRSKVIEECFHLLVLAKGSSLPLAFITRFLSIQLNMTERHIERTLQDAPLLSLRGDNCVGMNGVLYKCLCDIFVPAVRTEQMIHRLRQLCHFFVTNMHDTAASKVFRLLSSKILQYLALLDLCFPEYEEQRSLHHELGKAFLCVLVDYSSAVRCFTKAISIFEGSNDVMHPEYARLLNSLGNVLRLTGSMEDACKYLSKSLTILKAMTRGNVSEDVASCLSSLGLVCLSQGDLDRARELHYRALAIREQLHGNNHITTATSLNNIGGVYHERGDLATAKSYYWKALEIKGRNYGWDFPHVANSFNNIAEISHEQGDLCGAISIHKRALKIRQRLYGDEHPDVADSLNNIGVIHHKLQELSAARKYHMKALGIRKKIYGEDHLEVACSLSSLGEVYYHEGDLAAAEDCHTQALRIRQRQSVTSYHPEVITSLHNLMMVYIADQKLTTATAYAYEVFKVCQKIYGMRDARTVQAFRKLTELSKRGTHGQAFDMSLAVHEHVERLSSL